jgi:exopolysaccharide production protein ExoQ
MYCGVTEFKNQLGMTTLICAMCSLWCLLRAWQDKKMVRRKQHLAAHAIIIATAIWLFLTADSMTSFSCFMLAGSVLVMASQPWVAKRKALIHLMVVGVICVALSALFLDSSGSMVQTLGRDATLTGRTAIWNIVLELAQRRPLIGAGFETFWMGDRLLRVWQFEMGIQEAHNGYIEVYINLGWFGIAFIATLIVTGYRHVLDVLKRDRELGNIKLAYFIIGVIYSLTEAGFRMMCPVWIGFLFAIMAVPPNILKKKAAALPRKLKVQETVQEPVLATAYKEFV